MSASKSTQSKASKMPAEVETRSPQHAVDAAAERTLRRRMQVSLATWEISTYTALWILSVAYALYHLFLASGKYIGVLGRELEMGWFGPGRWRKDTSDSEWHVFSDVLLQGIPWLAVHFVGAQFLRRTGKQYLPMFYFLLGFIYLSKVLGVKGAVFLLLQPIVLFCVYRVTGSTALIYIFALGYKTFENTGTIQMLTNWAIDPQAYRLRYISSVTESWINSRAMSFCLDVMWGDVKSKGAVGDLWRMLAHSFYVPTCIGGPIVRYKEFNDGLESDYQPWTASRLKKFVSLLLRYVFWFIVTHLFSHVFYSSAMHYEPAILDAVDMWTLCGIGQAVGQFFHLKYTVFYGIPRAFFFADGMEDLPTPKCISRIHLYSDMWRHFDTGLYKFMYKYFYSPMVAYNNGPIMRLTASALTFVFVYIWHGQQESVFWWSVLNFLGITLEAVAKGISYMPSYARVERSLLTPRGRRRFYSLMASFSFLLAILSNFYFLMGQQAGDIYVRRTLSSWPIATPTLLFFLYCGSQFCYEVRNLEIRAKLGVPAPWRAR